MKAPIPSDATRTSRFKCEKFNCILAYGGCLARQAQRAKPGAFAKDQSLRPTYPFCAHECALGSEVRARFGDGPQTVLARSGLGYSVRHAPQPPRPVPEELPAGNSEPEREAKPSTATDPAADIASTSERDKVVARALESRGFKPFQVADVMSEVRGETAAERLKDALRLLAPRPPQAKPLPSRAARVEPVAATGPLSLDGIGDRELFQLLSRVMAEVTRRLERALGNPPVGVQSRR